MQGKWKEAKLNISYVPTIHDSMFVYFSTAKQQGKEENQKNAKAPPT